MQVVINGKNITISHSRNVSDLIQELKLEGKIAIELNQAIVPRSQYLKTMIQEDDQIEIVNAIGGG